MLTIFFSPVNGINIENTWQVHSGRLVQVTHQSTSTKTKMRFSVFIPEAATVERQVPALYWLSGLTCTDENFAQKATAAFKVANAKSIAIILPDTSPRGANCPQDKESWDFGEGAGFYLNATNPDYSEHYNMESYVMSELPSVISSCFKMISGRRSVSGHSMGGHGALTLYLKHPKKFVSCSAFAPITNPMKCPWGQKAFSRYFGAQEVGENQALWADHDATELVSKFVARGGDLNKMILIHQGLKDKFYIDKQLLPENFLEAANRAGLNIDYNAVALYDHSYFFVSTFIESHVSYHADILHTL